MENLTSDDDNILFDGVEGPPVREGNTSVLIVTGNQRINRP
jgi:hypothetical protein